MGKIKARMVATPGSKPVIRKKGKRKSGVGLKEKRGRPSKGKPRKGTARKDNYRTKYTDDDFSKAIADVKAGRLSIRAAAAQYKIPRTTIGDHMKGRVVTKIGRPTVLSEEEEAILSSRLITCAEFGFPMDSKDTRYLVKAYLDRLGKVTRFDDNLPGVDWLEGFLQRHRELTMRRANLIKRSRAAVSREMVREFFKEYAKVVEGVPPENIWNFDETNLADNPG